MAGSALNRLVRLFHQPELAGTPHLWDARGELWVDPALVARVGQLRTPSSRSYITPLSALDFPDRGVVVDANVRRDIGGMMHGRRFDGLLDVGVLNDETPSLVLPNSSGVMIGVDGYHRQTAQDGMPNVEQQTASAGADVALAFGPFSFHGEGFVRGQRVVSDPWTMSWSACARVRAYHFAEPGYLTLDVPEGRSHRASAQAQLTF